MTASTRQTLTLATALTALTLHGFRAWFHPAAFDSILTLTVFLLAAIMLSIHIISSPNS